ncbi:hypothetical protein AHiyo8_37150 [Arthrobacter sp. Hiyo8]|nr:hypothetical protein AHiyo8_37150 [Arthrobacter sp. Hiyo8]
MPAAIPEGVDLLRPGIRDVRSLGRDQRPLPTAVRRHGQSGVPEQRRAMRTAWRGVPAAIPTRIHLLRPGIRDVRSLGAINGRYQQLSADTGSLGYPSSDEQCGLPGGACRQQFQRGSIYFVPGYGTFSVVGAISGRYQSLGGLSGYLGARTVTSSAACGSAAARNSSRGQDLLCDRRRNPAGLGWPWQFLRLPPFPGRRHRVPRHGRSLRRAGNCSQSFQFGQLQWINGGGVRYTISTAGYCPL